MRGGKRYSPPVLAWLSLACSGEAPQQVRPPDVLLVVLDTVRADRTRPYGSSNDTPSLDALAQRGVVYEDVTSSSWTWPSHASLFTGEPPWVHGAHFTEGEGLALTGSLNVSRMRTDLPTLAERFSEGGYRTALLSSNKLLDPDFGLARGFEVAENFENSDDQALVRVEELLKEPDERPLFLVVNLFVGHGPWEVWPDQEELVAELDRAGWAQQWRVDNMLAPNKHGVPSLAEAWMTGSQAIPPEGWTLINQLYDGGVRQADRELAWLTQAWNRLGRNGVIAVTSDHGEYLGEHGLLFHCRTLYPEVTAVPLIVSAPGVVAEHQRVTVPMTLEDVGQGLLHLAGLEDESRLIDSIMGGAAPRPITARAWRDPAWAEKFGGRFSQGYRLYRDQDDALILADDGTAELYNVSEDPGMTQDLARDLVHRVRRLTAEAEGAYPESTSAPLQVDEPTQEQLKGMGYMD